MQAAGGPQPASPANTSPPPENDCYNKKGLHFNSRGWSDENYEAVAVRIADDDADGGRLRRPPLRVWSGKPGGRSSAGRDRDERSLRSDREGPRAGQPGQADRAGYRRRGQTIVQGEPGIP